eukprot:TRINITY_DN9013_c0_g1_i1.p1 TRINITY_DN9013_c0_g1~~TRINITY_DN9013_c0_g1_i1.p1  ORF type:complete len:609 (+),score=120.37 TRINITY_DN9013_c0_g1_i1:359-2185(+)
MANEAAEELDLSLDLSLGGSIARSKDKGKATFPTLIKYPSENLQPCLRKFATESLLKSTSGSATLPPNVAGSSVSDRPNEVDLRISAAPSKHKPVAATATWPVNNPHVRQEQKMDTKSLFGFGDEGVPQSRIFRTYSSGALGLAPNSSGLLRQSSLVSERKEEGIRPLVHPTNVIEWQRKREVQALRRQEARKKREEKQNKKAKRDESKSLTRIPSGIPHGSEPKNLIEIQRSLQREKDRAVKETEPKKRTKKKEGNDCIDTEQAENGFSGSADPPNKTETCLQDKGDSSENEKNKSPEGDSSSSPKKGPEIQVACYRSAGFPTHPYVLQSQLPAGFPFQCVAANWLPQTSSNGFSATSPGTANGLSAFQSHGSMPPWVMQLASGQMTSVSRTSSGRIPSSVLDQDSRSEGDSSNETKSHSNKSSDGSPTTLTPLSRCPSFSALQNKVSAFAEANANSKKEQPHSFKGAEKGCCTPPLALEHMPSIKSLHINQTSSSNLTAGHSAEVQSNTVSQDSISGVAKPDTTCKSPGNALHWVSTTGVGPNGITVTGILTSYSSSSQVKIICICHGISMSPAEFVQHAGSTDISNPEKNIVVSPMGIPTTLARG